MKDRYPVARTIPVILTEYLEKLFFVNFFKSLTFIHIYCKSFPWLFLLLILDQFRIACHLFYFQLLTHSMVTFATV